LDRVHDGVTLVVQEVVGESTGHLMMLTYLTLYSMKWYSTVNWKDVAGSGCGIM
jgi:hypothetical protein